VKCNKWDYSDGLSKTYACVVKQGYLETEDGLAFLVSYVTISVLLTTIMTLKQPQHPGRFIFETSDLTESSDFQNNIKPNET